MVVPLLVIYIKNVEVRTTLIVMIYPILIASLAHNSRFIIYRPLLYLAAVAAFVLLMGLRMIPKVKKALADPEKHNAISATVLSSTIGLFLIILVVGGINYGIYEGNVGKNTNKFNYLA